jgi:hypothetical protein
VKNNDAIKLTPEEQQATIAAYSGPITKNPPGKRVTRKPSKKAGESGSLQGSWAEAHDRWAYGECVCRWSTCQTGLKDMTASMWS